MYKVQSKLKKASIKLNR